MSHHRKESFEVNPPVDSESLRAKRAAILGKESLDPVKDKELIEKNRIEKLLSNLAEHYHGLVREFLAEPHEFGLALKVRGSKNAESVKDVFKKLGYKVTVGEHRSYEEKRADVHNISVTSTQFPELD